MLGRGRLSAALVALAFAFAIAVAGCGSTRTDRDEVRAAVERFARAAKAHDYTALCNHVLAPALLTKATAVGLPCELALKTYLGPTKQPTLLVHRIKLAGRRAQVLVRASATGQAPAVEILQLVKIGGDWRVADLAAAPGT
jgi:hypothetical protein